MKQGKWLYWIFVGCFVAVSGMGYSCQKAEEEILPAAESPETEAPSEETEGGGEIVVHICGEVKNPGLYRAPEGSRYGELLSLAGGPTDQADPNLLNLAKEARDGERLYVPGKGESLPEEEKEASGKVNLNTADAGELQSLPGIGEAKARSILTYREEHGPFSSIEELMKVPGIKEAVFSNVKQFIYVGGQP